MELEIQLLTKEHHKKEFDCNNRKLNDYIKKYALQDHKRNYARCYVLADKPDKKIYAFYTISTNSLEKNILPENFVKKLPYDKMPVFLIGRFAVDKHFQGKGVGKFLLIEALLQALNLSNKIGAFAVVVDPKDEKAKKFYKKNGFILLPGTGKMFIPIKTIEKLTKNEN